MTSSPPLPLLPADARLLAWTDGSCQPNPGRGGWGALLRAVSPTGTLWEEEISGGEDYSTNNRMEMQAAIAVLEAAPEAARLVIHADSSLLVNGMTVWIDGWRRRNWRGASGKPVDNRDLWERLAALVASRRVEWLKVRGHAGLPENERAHLLAERGRTGGARSEPVDASADAMPEARVSGRPSWREAMTPEELTRLDVVDLHLRDAHRLGGLLAAELLARLDAMSADDPGREALREARTQLLRRLG